MGGGSLVSFAYEPIEYMLAHGLFELSKEYFDLMDSTFIDKEYKPDWEQYLELEKKGNLGFFSLRNDEGKLLGYANLKVYDDIHQWDKKIGRIQDFYITKEYRGNASKFFNYIKNFAKMMSVYRIDISENIEFTQKNNDSGRFYALMGLKPMQITWSLVLEKQ